MASCSIGEHHIYSIEFCSFLFIILNQMTRKVNKHKRIFFVSKKLRERDITIEINKLIKFGTLFDDIYIKNLSDFHELSVDEVWKIIKVRFNVAYFKMSDPVEKSFGKCYKITKK